MTQRYLLVSASARLTKQGKDYFDLVLSDKEGRIVGKYWSNNPDMTQFVGNVIEISGVISEFNNEPQITINEFAITDDRPEDYCKKTKYDIENMYQQILRLINSFKNTELRDITLEILQKYGEEFKVHAGASSIHHSFVGGLLQHSLCVATSASKLCDVYKMADKDVVVAAAVLHDIGKLYELSNFPTVEYTRLGSCVGHITLSVLEIAKYVDRISDELVKDKLLNCIAAHHGQKEWGSPVTPVCVEAFIVHACDYLDAKIEIISEVSEKTEPGKMSSYIPALGSAVVGINNV